MNHYIQTNINVAYMKILFLLAIILLIGIPPAFGDFIPINYAWNEQPVICIDIPEEMKDIYTKRAFLEGITPWENKLNNVTNSENFDFRIIFDSRYECNVIIDYKKIIKDDEGRSKNVLAEAYCNKSMIFGHSCTITFDNSQVMFKNHREMVGIIKHEMGHVLGLGHRQPLPDENIMASLISISIENDIMFPQQGPFQKITDVDLEVLLFMYGEDGWKGDNISRFDYIIKRYS